jgi:transketolase
MLNEHAHLSHMLFSRHEDRVPVRDGYGQGLLEAGSERSVVVLGADVEESTRCHWFRSVYPERYFEIGIAEQNMAGIAAGLGISGKIPFINSYATFSPGRNWEQVRTLCAYNDANVKIAGHHAGISTGPDGATHQAIEDIAIMRAIPNMKVVAPCDALEAHRATLALSQIWGPAYIRLQREATPLITTKETPFTLGKAYPLWITKRKKVDVLIAGAGPILHEALAAARELEREKIGAVVLNVHTVKPLDEREILSWARKSSAVVSVEEHSVIGGVGSAIAELLMQKNPMPMEMVGVRDIFGQSGTAHELLERYHLAHADIAAAAHKALKRTS